LGLEIAVQLGAVFGPLRHLNLKHLRFKNSLITDTSRQLIEKNSNQKRPARK
jgi:hypothetical protein